MYQKSSNKRNDKCSWSRFFYSPLFNSHRKIHNGVQYAVHLWLIYPAIMLSVFYRLFKRLVLLVLFMFIDLNILDCVLYSWKNQYNFDWIHWKFFLSIGTCWIKVLKAVAHSQNDKCSVSNCWQFNFMSIPPFHENSRQHTFMDPFKIRLIENTALNVQVIKWCCQYLMSFIR